LAAVFPVAAELPAVGEGHGMICPKCQRESLKERRVRGQGFTVDLCSQCRGIWFDGGELRQAIPKAEKRPAVPPHAVRLEALCPRCDKPLYAFPYPQTRITIEMCRKCKGLWLDGGEFAAIRQARQQRKDEPSVEESAEPDGVKGTLIEFIDSAIDWLLY